MNRLKQARKEAGLTQKEVAERLGVSQNAYSYWETGKVNPDIGALTRLCALFGCSADYLLGLTEISRGGTERIPVLADARGDISEAYEWVEVPCSLTTGGGGYFAVRVWDDAMYPLFLKGDTVVLRRSYACADGELCLARVGGEAFFGRCGTDTAAGTLSLAPANPMYPPRTYTREELVSLPVCILGTPVELLRRIR